jgi:tetratricopeptide (TPR) repeat protein
MAETPETWPPSLPSDRIFLLENHDQAYHAWRDLGVKDRILVHLDAHHDMWWIADDAPVTIANFICPAIKNDHLKEIWWVVPDSTWATGQNRKHLVRHLKWIADGYPAPRSRLQFEHRRISTTVLGKRLGVCSLDSLPPVNENVLLDIDIDFFVIPRVSYGKTDVYSKLPWCWPSDVLASLSSCGIRSDLVTIACSVNGGYTPLKWKYFGDELALRLRGSKEETGMVRGMDVMREAALAADRNDLEAAERMYRQAADLLPSSAAPSHHLARLQIRKGIVTEARHLYQRALSLDASYRTPYGSAGLQAYWQGRFRESEREFQEMLKLDPSNAEAYYGLGLLAKRRRRWRDAASLLRKVVELKAGFLDGYRVLGEVLAKQGQAHEAITAYTYALKLALAGQKPLYGTVITCPEGDRHMKDPLHFQTYARLARLQASLGDAAKAINLYRTSIAGGNDGPCVRYRLASLYLRTAQWQNAWGEFKNAGRALQGSFRGRD